MHKNRFETLKKFAIALGVSLFTMLSAQAQQTTPNSIAATDALPNILAQRPSQKTVIINQANMSLNTLKMLGTSFAFLPDGNLVRKLIQNGGGWVDRSIAMPDGTWPARYGNAAAQIPVLLYHVHLGQMSCYEGTDSPCDKQAKAKGQEDAASIMSAAHPGEALYKKAAEFKSLPLY